MNSDNQLSVTLADKARAIDQISSRALSAFEGAESFEKELAVAQAIGEMRAALTTEVMQPVMALMNTPLGFRTDRDPTATPKDKDGNPVTPYPMEVVREAFIESRLRGFHAINNEFNIIAGRFYGCLTGFERLVRKSPKVTDLREFFEVPRMMGEGALVKCRAEWKQDGHKQTLEREFAIRVNRGMGADAITGKAKRKLFAAIHARLTGTVTPEGEASDAIDVTATATPAATASASEAFGKATSAKPENNAGAQPEKTEAKTESKSVASAASPAPISATAPAPSASTETPQQDLARFLGECGVSFEDFRDFANIKGLLKNADSFASYDDLPAAFCTDFKGRAKTVAELVKKFGKVQQPK